MQEGSDRVRREAKRAHDVVVAGEAFYLRGEARHLRKVAAALRGEDMSVFLGDDDEGRTVLCVEPHEPESEGVLVSSRSRL